MDSPQFQLLARLEAFRFDHPEDPLTFSARLAHEQGWSLDFTHRAIAEYRRFAFLAVAAGHPVTPSDEVDQVWHHHLTYTRSYWEQFCPEVLGQSLHHEPTRGGPDDTEKFVRWYEQTLQSYERFFHQKPPPDLWPPPEIRFQPKAGGSWLSRLRTWAGAIPFRAALPSAGLVVLAGAAGGCASMFGSTLNPLDLPGGEFLQFFWTLAGCAYLGAVLWRWQLRGAGANHLAGHETPSGYPVTILSGGRPMAIYAALARLTAIGALRVEGTLLKVQAQPPANSPEFEQVIFERVRGLGAVRPRDLSAFATPQLLAWEGQLQEAGYLLTAKAAWQAHLRPWLLGGAVLVLGMLKMVVGLNRHKPITFLVISCVVYGVLLVVSIGKRPRRTRLGDAELNKLRREHVGLLRNARASRAPLGDATLPMAVALFGYPILTQYQLGDLHRVIQPPPTSSSSGCGSSGCGGGGGGGGGCGGGGGGGCGGCGGSN